MMSDSIVVPLMLCIRSMVAQLFVNDFTALIISVGILLSSKALISQECDTNRMLSDKLAIQYIDFHG